MGRNVPGSMTLKTLGYQETTLSSSLRTVYLVVAMVIVLLQIHIVCLVAALVMIHFLKDPHCISRGHDLVNGVQHGFAMYYWQLCLVTIFEFV